MFWCEWYYKVFMTEQQKAETTEMNIARQAIFGIINTNDNVIYTEMSYLHRETRCSTTSTIKKVITTAITVSIKHGP